MTIGDKIKKIRTFRNMTQAELGAALGWGDKGANRLAQYETNYRVPRKDLVTEMAKILDVNPLTLHEPTTMNASELMEILFWIDEFNPGMINLFQLETYPGEKSNSSDDTAIRYHNSDSWPAHPCSKFFQMERLCQIIVCTCIQTVNLIRHFTTGRQNQHLCVTVGFSECS